MSSHDVVSRVRRLAGTRAVGHAGTLDPMATGVLVLGIGRATKLLGYVSRTDKEYAATIRLGQSTVTDDAEGTLLTAASAQDVTSDDVRSAMLRFTGDIEQRPSAVSAIKVDGQRAYARVRAGEDVVLPSRLVTVSTFDLLSARRPTADLLDLDVHVQCSTGTYIRALARDLGDTFAVGGHLTALRRTRVGGFGIESARTLQQLAENFAVLSLDAAVAQTFPCFEVTADAARDISHGKPIDGPPGEGVIFGVFGPAGNVLALMTASGKRLTPIVVFEAAGGPTQPGSEKMSS